MGNLLAVVKVECWVVETAAQKAVSLVGGSVGTRAACWAACWVGWTVEMLVDSTVVVTVGLTVGHWAVEWADRKVEQTAVRMVALRAAGWVDQLAVC